MRIVNAKSDGTTDDARCRSNVEWRTCSVMSVIIVVMLMNILCAHVIEFDPQSTPTERGVQYGHLHRAEGFNACPPPQKKDIVSIFRILHN